MQTMEFFLKMSIFLELFWKCELFLEIDISKIIRAKGHIQKESKKQNPRYFHTLEMEKNIVTPENMSKRVLLLCWLLPGPLGKGLFKVSGERFWF